VVKDCSSIRAKNAYIFKNGASNKIITSKIMFLLSSRREIFCDAIVYQRNVIIELSQIGKIRRKCPIKKKQRNKKINKRIMNINTANKRC